MRMTFPWYGDADPVTLKEIKQMPGVTDIASALYDIPAGEAWPLEKILALKEKIEAEGLTLSVIESVPLHEDIKTGNGNRDAYIENYCITLRNLAEAGIRCVCYNFMPAFDSTSHDLSDGANALAYLEDTFKKPNSIPGDCDASQTENDTNALLENYSHISEEQLWDNLKYFLDRVIKVAEEVKIKMAIHPDDPSRGISGLPGMLTGKENLEKFLKLYDSPYNGLTLCNSSIGAMPQNDIPDFIRTFGDRIHFAHVGNTKTKDEKCAEDGTIDIYEIMQAYADAGFDGYACPGYGHYDRALGAVYINGIWETIKKKEAKEKLKNEKRERFGSNLFETVAFVMVCLFAFLPMFAFKKSAEHGTLFKFLGMIEIVAFIICFVLYMIHFVKKCRLLSFKTAFCEMKNALFRYFKKNKHALMLLGMFILVVISYAALEEKGKAWMGTNHRPDGLFMHIVFAILFMFAAAIKKKQYKNIVIGIYIATFVFVAVIAIQQYYGILGTGNAKYCPQWAKGLYNYYSKIKIRAGHFYLGETGTFYNPNHMGYYTAMGSMLATAVFIKSKKVLTGILSALLCVLSYWTIIVNDTFGAFLAIGATLTIFALMLWKKSGCKKIKPFIPVAIFVAVCIGVSIIPYKDSKKLVIGNFVRLSEDTKNISEGNDKADSAGSGRLRIWKITLDMIEEKPWIGYGPNRVSSEYGKRGTKLDRAHCEILERAVSTGVPSALLYVAAIIYIIIKGAKRKNLLSDDDATLAPYMAVVAYSLSALTGVFLFYTASHYFILMGLMSEQEDG